ncbi:hypothetical protein [Levilactobacillus suantsaii]|nr:hypothetical protein [Levilactobacillus suantsaii]QMU07169.1 hypothetical protein H3M12_06585 [Levilactobacillus suantsaii]
MTEKQSTTPNFKSLGDADASAVCGPDGCNIAEHREQKEPTKKGAK